MSRNGTPDRIESAANITLVVMRGAEQQISNAEGSLDDADFSAGDIEIPISRLDTTKEIEISEIRESSLKASGYSITSISYSGKMTFKGSRYTKNSPDSDDSAEPITNFLYYDNGVPRPCSININHDLNGETDEYLHVLASSESYEVRNESETETAFDWVAMDRASDQPDN